ncbi:MAG: bacillithiol system redox-active protein YtxJ [Agriterribacter sp.]
MKWNKLETEAQWQQVLENSKQRLQLVYKHSTRCSISSVVKSRLERAKEPADVDFYFLDLISFRSVSNKIAEDMRVMHESPQVLLIKDGRCIYNESHTGISMDDIVAEGMRA